MSQQVTITVTLDCGCTQEFTDVIEEKYPFYCDEHDNQTGGKYPWSIATSVVAELTGQP